MMRYIYLLLALAFAGCISQNSNLASMAGAYNMLSQTFKGASIDTTYTQKKQLKIYTDSFMMYVRVNPADSVGSFGIGTYSIDSGRLTENIIYSATDTAQNTNIFSGTVNITRSEKGYIQVIPEIMSDKGKIRLTEEYESIATTATSPLDGVWKQVSAYTVTGKDTVRWSDIQYKTFFAGNFAYGEYQISNAGKSRHTFVSYGTFTLKSDTLTETILASNTFSITAKIFTLNVVMNGSNAFTQTINTADGNKEVIVYERVKK